MVAVEVQKILSRANIIALPIKVSCFESHVFTILMFTIMSSDEDNCFMAQIVKRARKRRKSARERGSTIHRLIDDVQTRIATSRICSIVADFGARAMRGYSQILKSVARPRRKTKRSVDRINKSSTSTVVTFETAKETATRRKRAWFLVLFVDIENWL